MNKKSVLNAVLLKLKRKAFVPEQGLLLTARRTRKFSDGYAKAVVPLFPPREKATPSSKTLWPTGPLTYTLLPRPHIGPLEEIYR